VAGGLVRAGEHAAQHDGRRAAEQGEEEVLVGEGEAVAATSGWVMAYSPEYRQVASGANGLMDLVGAGKLQLADTDPRAAFSRARSRPSTPLPMRPWALALATVLLVLDIASRRLVVGRADLQRAARALTGRLSRRQPDIAPIPARAAGMRALFEAKQRARSPSESTDQPPIDARPAANAPDSEDGPISLPANPPQRSASPGELAARLLAHKQGKSSREEDSSDGQV